MIIDDSRKDPKNPLADQKPSAFSAPQAPTVTPLPQAPAASALKEIPAEQLMALIQLMAQREARAAKAEEEDFARKEARRAQYELNRTDDEKTSLLRQATCRHLKGGKNRKRNAAVDHAVYMHTFITGETYIKCQVCGMKWRPTDTVARVVRNGKVYNNHTKTGWAEALELVATSTNQSSRSEIPPAMFKNVAPEVAMPNPTAVDIDTEPLGDAASVTI